MSSWKKAAKTGQKTHRERHQPEAREHLGILEKKDYKLRADDYNEKQSALKLLRKRAQNKNPDEFYFHMINSKIDDEGIHREKDEKEQHTNEQIKLMETQDLKYVSHKRHIEAKKIEKLQSQLHLLDAANSTKNQHIFFVDDTEEEKFDLAKKLDTHPALLDRRTNRPRLSRIKDMKLPDLNEATLAKIEQQKHMSYTELRKRIDREHELTVVQEKLEARRSIKEKRKTKPKLIRRGSQQHAPIYKWPYERKK